MTDPYESVPYDLRQLVNCRVSPEDYEFIRRIFFTRRGPTQTLLNTLFHAFIERLRLLGIDPAKHPHLHTACGPNDFVAKLIDTELSLLCEFLRRPPGGCDGCAGAQPLTGATLPLHPPVCDPQGLSPDPQREDQTGEQRPVGQEADLGEDESNDGHPELATTNLINLFKLIKPEAFNE